MPFAKKHKETQKRTQWFLRAIVVTVIAAFFFDYGKHLALKGVLEKEISASQGLVSVGSLTVVPWPLFQTRLNVANFQVHISGTPLAIQSASIRQDWLEWRLARVQAVGLESGKMVNIEKAQGTLDAAALKERVDVSNLTLMGIQAHLPLLDFSGKHASFQFLYDMVSRHLSLAIDAPEMAFSNGATFGLSGKGSIEAKDPVQGKMDVKIKNVDKMMKELVSVGVIDASQADLVIAGSDFFGKLGLHDVTLPLTIQGGDVSLGPVSLFKVGKDKAETFDKGEKMVAKVINVFRYYKPLIEATSEDIVREKGLSKEDIAQALNSQTPLSAISLKVLNDIAQVVFLRPRGMERKDIKPHNAKFLPYTNQQVFDLFCSIGMIRPVYPKKKTYTYILINGATVQNMRQRLKALVDLVESKRVHITPETNIIFLTGDRDLFVEENETQLMDSSPFEQDPSWLKPSALPKTEAEAARWIWEQSQLPSSLKGSNIVFVQAQKKTDPKTGQSRRPTTFDTVVTWVTQSNPMPGTCLSVSSQPFVSYQEITTRGVFKKAGLLDQGFSVEGVGPGMEEDNLSYFQENIAMILDNFARTIYTQVQNDQ